MNVVVERIFPFGAFVRLPDGREGYIRQRELALDADADPKSVIREGETIQAVVLEVPGAGKHIELSRRRTLPDPWKKFLQDHKAGDIVQGEVRALHFHGAFVRLQPGIDGFVPLNELAPVPVEKPEEVVWIGDRAEAVILRIAPEKREISLSIKARMHQYDQALAAAGTLFKAEPETRAPAPAVQEVENLEKAGPLLIIEDDDQLRDQLKEWFSQRGVEIHTLSTSSQVNSLTSYPYRVILVDFHLTDGNGLNVLHAVKSKGYPGHLCLMSSPGILAERAAEIEALGVTEVFAKPLDLEELERFLVKVRDQEKLKPWKAGAAEVQSPPAEATPDAFQVTDRGVGELLEELAGQLKAQQSILFWLDPSGQTISILASHGVGEINEKALYGLRESPVEDVIVNGMPVFELAVGQHARKRFEKLLEVLPFESCIGVPVTVRGYTNHALFFFHPEKDAFSKYRVRDARAGALLIAALLNDQLIEEQLRNLNPVLLNGELAASFQHDVYNKLTGLEIATKNLINAGSYDPRRAEFILDLILDLKYTISAFQENFQQRPRLEPMDINQVLERACRMIADQAKKENVTLARRLAPELPRVAGNPVYLQQAILNIMLNAIQQTAVKKEKYSWKGAAVLEISTVCERGRVFIRFKDNGPGVHRNHLEHIFNLGFSTRGGSGLGLFIAHSFIGSLKGKLYVEESVVPLGATFTIELPAATEVEDE